MIKSAPIKHSFTYESNTYNVFHVNVGEGIPHHMHSFSHATICHAGSCVIRKEGKEKIINKETGAINLKANEWHEIEALEDNTVFVNIFASDMLEIKMAFAVTGVLVRIQFLDSSGASIYTGDPNTSIYAWGAQLEFNEYFEDALQDLNNYRYIRTRGVTSSHFDQRFGLDNREDLVEELDKPYNRLSLLAHSAGDFTLRQVDNPDATSSTAAITAELFTETNWYRLVPLYSSYVNIWNNPNNRGDIVTVNRLDTIAMDVVEDYDALSGTIDFETDSGDEDYKYLPVL